MKKNLGFCLLLANAAFAAQTIQVHVRLPDNSPSAELLLVVNDIDTGRMTPYLMPLSPGQNLQTFNVEGNHYSITQWKIQAPNLQFIPCAASQQVDNHSLTVDINGKIAQGGLSCISREVTTIPQLYTPTATAPTAAITTPNAPAATTDPKAGYAEIAKYLTALSSNCTPGEFHAKFETQVIDYTILGKKSGKCNVSIDVNNAKKPLLCPFTDNDIALLGSPAEIQRYKDGTPESAASSLNTRIMNARCKPI